MPANQYRGEVDIKLGGKDCILRYGLGARSKFQEKFGKTINSVILSLNPPRDGLTDEQHARLIVERFGERDLAQLLWVGLLYDHKTITLEDVERMMDASPLEGETYWDTFMRLTKGVLEAWSLSARGVPAPAPAEPGIK